MTKKLKFKYGKPLPNKTKKCGKVKRQFICPECGEELERVVVEKKTEVQLYLELATNETLQESDSDNSEDYFCPDCKSQLDIEWDEGGKPEKLVCI